MTAIFLTTVTGTFDNGVAFKISVETSANVAEFEKPKVAYANGLLSSLVSGALRANTDLSEMSNGLIITNGFVTS